MHPVHRGTFPQVIDSTIRSEFASCQTKGYWSFVRQLGSPFPSVDLIAGGAFAKGVEVTRFAYYGERKPLAEALEDGMKAAIVAYGNLEVPESKENKALPRVVQAIAAYFEQYPPDTDYIQPLFANDGRPMVEFTFSIPLPILHPDTGEPILYAGRFDMVGLYNGQIFGVDEKTTSQLGPTWKNKWNLRGQFTGYTWAMREYGKPAVGCIARGVSFLKKSFGFEESIQQRSQWMIDQWYAQMLADVEAAKVAYTSNWYNQNFDEACAAYGGCPFQRLCTAAEPENWIEGHYAPRTWNPLEKVPGSQPEQKIEVIQAPEELRALIKQQS